MTDQDMQTVEAVIAAFRREEVDTMLDLTHPDGEWVNPDYAIEAGTRHGREEIRQAIERLFEFFEEVEVESMERAPDGRIVVISRVRSRGMAGGRGIEAHTSTIFTIRDGLVLRYEWFLTPEEGRAQAGLATED
jgi:ketosteroid isomerase-like protein